MDVSTKQIKMIIEAQDAAYYQQLLRDAVRLDFAPSAATMKIALELYAPRLFTPGRGQPTSHQLAALHQRYAERMLYQYAKAHMPCIEIGPNPTGMMSLGANQEKMHGCCLFTARDQSRYTTSAASRSVRGCRDRKYFNQVQLLAGGIPTEKFCVQGFGKCDFQAPFGIANHSLYDISLQEIAAGMYNHNMTKIIAYMHLTPAALHCDEYSDNKNQIRHKVITDSLGVKKIFVGFPNDPGWVYEHDFDTAMAYLIRSGLETPFGFNLMIERTVNFGSHFCIHITRSSLPVRIHSFVPSAYVGCIGVPDFFVLAAQGFHRSAKIPIVVTDKLKAQRLYHYLLARDEKQADLRAAFSYARAELRKVTLGDQIIDHQWEIESEDFIKVVVGVYLMSRLAAAKNHAVIALTKDAIDKLNEKRSWFEKFFPKAHDIFKAVQAYLDEAFSSKYEVMRLVTGSGDNPMQRIAFEHFNEQLMSEEFNAEGLIEEVRFEPILHYEETPQGIMPPVAARPTESQSVEADTNSVPEIDDQDLHNKFVSELKKGIADTELKAMKTVLTAALEATTEVGVVPFEVDKFQGLFGVPGGCKTAQAFLKYIPTMVQPGETFLYIVPSSNLKDSLASRITPPNRLVTMHMAMDLLHRGRVKPSLILVDECFRLPLPMLAFYSHFAKVLLIGDPNQITHIDRDSIWLDSPQLKNMYRCIKHDFLMESSRMPKDICDLPFIASTYPGITTTSKRGTDSEGAHGPSINFVHANYKRAGAQVLVLTKENVVQYQNEGAVTVDTAQGGTFNSVIFHIGDSPGEKWLLQNSPSHIIVGLSRHTFNLFIREETPGTLNAAMKYHMGGQVEVDILLKESNVGDPRFAEPQRPNYSTTQVSKEPVPYVSAAVNPISVDDVLSNIYPGVTGIHEYQSVESTYFPFHGGGNAVARIDDLPLDAVEESKGAFVHRFPMAQRVKVTNAKSTGMSLRTLLDRYTKKTKNMREEAAVHSAQRIHEILCEYIDFSCSEDDKKEVLGEAMEKFQLRGHDVKMLKDIDCWTDQNATLVKFNTKSQQKMTAKDPLTTDKAGQGIAAWDKSLNFKMVVWTRLLERVALRAKNGLIFASNRTDVEMLHLLDAIAQEDDYEYLEGDWTEFDSAQNNLEHHLLMANLKALGCPPELRDNFLKMMRIRYVQSRVGSVRVEGKKDSGRVDTLIGNSLFNIGVLLTCVNRAELKYILYKGDDSLLVGRKIRPNFARLSELDSQCNYKLKLAVSKSAEFTSFVLNSNGAALNIPRISAKVATRNYTEDKYGEYVLAVKDLIKSSNDVEVAQKMCQVNAAHFRVASSDVDLCLSFLHNFARHMYRFESLMKFDSRTKIEGM